MIDHTKAMHYQIGELRDRIKELEAALKPFAAIKPSSLYASDGSENEGYVIYVFSMRNDGMDFTGKDLARARVALKTEGGDNAEAR
jgi:hypothetical protein